MSESILDVRGRCGLTAHTAKVGQHPSFNHSTINSSAPSIILKEPYLKITTDLHSMQKPTHIQKTKEHISLINSTQIIPEEYTMDASLHTLLETLLPSRPSLRTSVLPALLTTIAQISETLRQSSQVAETGTSNAFDDAQLNVDLSSEAHMQAALQECPSVKTFSSEEVPQEISVKQNSDIILDSASKEEYTIAYDPLDGSSIIDANWTVGTIIGIWDGSSALNKRPSEAMVAAILGVYGPRTTAIVSVKDGTTGQLRCFEVGGLDKKDASNWVLVREKVTYAEPPFKTKYFSPANLRAAADDGNYKALIDHYVSSKYTLRYSGGLVPDVVHALVKGNGIYLSPVTGGSKAKLRVLYELCPIAFIVESAGGEALDAQTFVRTLDKEIRDCDERGGLICGVKTEIETVVKMLGGSS